MDIFYFNLKLASLKFGGILQVVFTTSATAPEAGQRSLILIVQTFA